MIEVVPFSSQHQAGVIDVIQPIQQIEFGIPITSQEQSVPSYYLLFEGDNNLICINMAVPDEIT